MDRGPAIRNPGPKKDRDQGFSVRQLEDQGPGTGDPIFPDRAQHWNIVILRERPFGLFWKLFYSQDGMG